MPELSEAKSGYALTGDQGNGQPQKGANRLGNQRSGLYPRDALSECSDSGEALCSIGVPPVTATAGTAMLRTPSRIRVVLSHTLYAHRRLESLEKSGTPDEPGT